jgi:hypothetical protein
MKTSKVIIVLLVVLAGMVAGCQRGDVMLSPVIEGQPAPHAGYNIGPELWVEPGNPVKVTGAVIWIRGVDPNSIFGE